MIDFVDTAGASVMHVTVVSPERQVFDGEATAVVAPAYDGRVGILPHHAPFLTLVGKGDLIVRHGGAEARPSRWKGASCRSPRTGCAWSWSAPTPRLRERARCLRGFAGSILLPHGATVAGH